MKFHVSVFHEISYSVFSRNFILVYFHEISVYFHEISHWCIFMKFHISVFS